MKQAIEIYNLSKRYHLQPKEARLLRVKLEQAVKDPFSWFKSRIMGLKEISQRKSEFWALKGINLLVNQGETIGIIGQNGAGKSTLLKILAGVILPTSGKVILHGSVGSLLEIGAGFHPELSGKENIYLTGIMLGLTTRQIEERFAEIVAFSGIGKFLYMPVKYYSSGMYVRLAFSVAIQLDPDILLVDDVLAVGDAQFREKSLAKIQQSVKDDNRTVVIVSHNIGIIKRLCQRVILLDKGKIKKEGKAEEVIHYYLQTLGQYQENKRQAGKQQQKNIFYNTLKFSHKNLSRLADEQLIELAQTLYSPMPLVPVPGWSVGKLVYQNRAFRYPLVRLWQEISARQKLAGKPIQVGWYRGIKLCLFPRSEISRCVFAEGCYEPNELYLLSRLLKPGMIFIDVGANMGIYTLLAASLVGFSGKVISIEPSSREYQRLQQQIKKNGFSNIWVFQKALFSRSKKAQPFRIASTGAEGHNTLGRFVYQHVKLLRKEKIDLITLDDLVKQEKLEKIDIIKMDIEGAEFAALKGGRKVIKKYRPLILLEVSKKSLSMQKAKTADIWRFFDKVGYTLFHFDRQTGFPTPLKNKDEVENENIIAIASGSDWQKKMAYLIKYEV